MNCNMKMPIDNFWPFRALQFEANGFDFKTLCMYSKESLSSQGLILKHH